MAETIFYHLKLI